MSTDYRNGSPQLLLDFLAYHESVKAHSQNTIDEYYLDLRTYFRYLKLKNHLVPKDTDPETIDISDVDLDLVGSVQLSDIYQYLTHLTRDRSLNSASRARKVSSIRSFYKYLTSKAGLLSENPVQDLDAPRIRKSLPKYLTLSESIRLLESVKGKNAERDYCILTLFLNCGLRISELVNLNVSDIHGDTIRILGKGEKERILYLNDACLDALKQYFTVRNAMTLIDDQALFVTSRKTRITVAGVHKLVKKHLQAAGLDPNQYSAHKLRHTAATLMLQSGVDVRTLQELLGHDHLNTTQIYTHVESENLEDAAKRNPLSGLKKQK